MANCAGRPTNAGDEIMDGKAKQSGPCQVLAYTMNQKQLVEKKILMLLSRLSFVEEIKVKAMTIIHHLVMGMRQICSVVRVSWTIFSKSMHGCLVWRELDCY